METSPINSLFDLSNRTAIVTGAGKGIGKSIALGLASAGANVVLCSRTPEDLEEVKLAIEGLGQEAFATPCDVTREEDIQRVVQETQQRYSSIDILVNNAGRTVKKPAVDLELKEWKQIISLNLTAVFQLSQLVGREMMKQRSGRIINISSIASKTALTHSVAYCASKGGLNMLTKVLAAEWAQYGIQVNGIAPAYIETPLIEKVKQTQSNFIEQVKQRTPMGRLGETHELVGAALFLASEASSYMTGETIFVDGGWQAAGI